MTRIALALPDHLRAHADNVVAAGQYANLDQYIAALVEADRTNTGPISAETERLLLEAVDGPFEEWTEGDFDDIVREGTQILEQRKSGSRKRHTS